MSRLDFCKYELVGDCYDWKNDNCDECNIFKAYCEGARMAKASIVRCKDCIYWGQDGYKEGCKYAVCIVTENDWCSFAERREE